jgi:lysine N6-hydroxylase
LVHNLSSDQLLFYHASRLVIGVGSLPSITHCANNHYQWGNSNNNIIHSSDYLFRKDSILEQANVIIVGSGQSAAEIFYDLLQYSDHMEQLSWFTRASRFYPMEYSRLTLEMTSPDYIDHFYSLPAHKRKEILQTQDPLYKGINFSLINDIYDALYLRSSNQAKLSVQLHTHTELTGISEDANQLKLSFYHTAMERHFEHNTGALILATGYTQATPAFLDSIKDHLQWNDDGLYNVNRNYSIDSSRKRIFVQNAELHTHGFSAPDLGMGPYRNATILNAILGYEHFTMEKNVAFQTFGLPVL